MAENRLNRTPVAAVHALLDSRLQPLSPESVPLADVAGRVLANAIFSPVDVPSFRKSAMDGFALRAADTSPSREIPIVGEAFPAKPFARELQPGETVRIATGAPVPPGADAILMIELAEVRDNCVRARTPVAIGKHVIVAGEDVARGTQVLPANRVLRPQDLGVLASIGVANISVIARPRVAILVTGNELLPPGTAPTGFQIVDSNSPMLAALITRDGAIPQYARHLRDEFSTVRDAIAHATTTADAVIVTGGTSVGAEDHAPRAVAELGELAVHGIAIRPGAPSGIAFVPDGSRTVPVFLLPGNPVACLCAYDLFASRAIRRLGARPHELPYRTHAFTLTETIRSATGRVDYVRVKVNVAEKSATALATTGASNLSSTATADGFVLVPEARDSLAPGETVTVWLYD